MFYGVVVGCTPVIHAGNHFDHKIGVAWVPISMNTCGSVSIIMVLRLAAVMMKFSLNFEIYFLEFPREIVFDVISGNYYQSCAFRKCLSGTMIKFLSLDILGVSHRAP